MRRNRWATEQSSGIATSGIGGETDAEGLEDGELLRSKRSRASKAASLETMALGRCQGSS